jgi:hypothetical protein
MANQALARLETALRARKLDNTLTTALPSPQRPDPAAPTGVAALDVRLQGGLPRGQLSEIVGVRSSGRSLLLLQMAGVATRRGELAALVDTLDTFDVTSALSAGIRLERLLWIRGDAIAGAPLMDRAIGRALKAFNLVLQAGGFGLVALDLADVPPAALARIPPTTWLRVQRVIEGSDTACVLLAPQPLARSAGGVTLALAGRARWGPRPGARGSARHLDGIDVTVRVVSPRRRVDGELTFAASASDGPDHDPHSSWPVAI